MHFERSCSENTFSFFPWIFVRKFWKSTLSCDASSKSIPKSVRIIVVCPHPCPLSPVLTRPQAQIHTRFHVKCLFMSNSLRTSCDFSRANSWDRDALYVLQYWNKYNILTEYINDNEKSLKPFMSGIHNIAGVNLKEQGLRVDFLWLESQGTLCRICSIAIQECYTIFSPRYIS